MGAAFAVVLVLIYVLTVGWFRSFTTPFVIMLPIYLATNDPLVAWEMDVADRPGKLVPSLGACATAASIAA